MSQTVIVASKRDPVQYPAVHGGEGPALLWNCFARRGMVFTEIEGFEVARMPPGATIAEHTHTRTDEIYLITAGSGEMTLDGESMRVSEGDLVMLPRTHSHGLVNDGSEELEILVIELLPPNVASQLPLRTPFS